MASRRSILPALTLLVLAACGGRNSRGAVVARGEGKPVIVNEASDEAFAGEVHKLLTSEPGSSEREASLAAALGRQMSRAAQRFKTRSPERGLLAVNGGLALVRTGELRQGLLGPNGHEALRAASRELSARGDEGRARAVFEILSRMWPAEEADDAKQHIANLVAWSRDATKSLGPVSSAGALEVAAVSRRMLEPSDVARDEAAAATTTWIERATALREMFKAHHVQPPREEVGETVRALKTAPTVLMAIFLRDGDAKGALAAIDHANARDLVRGDILRALQAVADTPTSSHWLELAAAVHPQREGDGQQEESDDEEVGDPEILRAVILGAVLEAYRLDPTAPEAGWAVAGALGEMGMAEAIPTVLIDGAKAHPDPKVVGSALGLTMRAMGGELNADDVEAARRVYRAALPLVQLADGPQLAGKLSPSAARVRAMMGEIELREGRLAESRALLEAALKQEKSGAVLLALARIDRHDEKVAAALSDLRDALTQKDATSEPALRGEILLLTSDITREQGDGTAARTPLTLALHDLQKARTGAEGDDRARIERTLARVLDRFGADKSAEKALERSLDAAPRSKSEASATIGELVGRAFVRGDLKAARDGLQRGIGADLETEDIVYYALWVRLLERQLRATTDGTADRVFANALDAPRWVGRLAAFGAGLIKPSELLADAKTPSQKTEALFYGAMDRRVAGDVQGANAALKQVVTAGGVDQMEVSIARDLLNGGAQHVPGPVPPEASAP